MCLHCLVNSRLSLVNSRLRVLSHVSSLCCELARKGFQLYVFTVSWTRVKGSSIMCLHCVVNLRLRVLSYVSSLCCELTFKGPQLCVFTVLWTWLPCVTNLRPLCCISRTRVSHVIYVTNSRPMGPRHRITYIYMCIYTYYIHMYIHI